MSNFNNYSVLYSNRLLNSKRTDKQRNFKHLNLLGRKDRVTNLSNEIDNLPLSFFKPLKRKNRKNRYLKKRRLGYLLSRLYKLNFLSSSLLIKKFLVKLKSNTSIENSSHTIFNTNFTKTLFNKKASKIDNLKHVISYKKFTKKNKRKTNIIGIYLYNTFNNYYIVCFDPISRKILSFISCGMVYSLKRYNRKNKYTLELCGRRIALLLKNNNYKFAFLVLKSYFRKKFLKSTIKGLRFYRLRIRTIYDHRILPHNGCLKRKARRL